MHALSPRRFGASSPLRLSLALVAAVATLSPLAAQEEPLFLGIEGVAGYASFDEAIVTSLLDDGTTAEGYVLQNEAGETATVVPDLAIDPFGRVHGTVAITIGDAEPVIAPVFGMTRYRRDTLISPPPVVIDPATGDTTEPVEPVVTTFHRNDFEFRVAPPPPSTDGTPPTLPPYFLVIRGREHFMSTNAPAPAVVESGFQTRMILKAADGAEWRGEALVDGLTLNHARFLTDPETFHSMDPAGFHWVGNAMVAHSGLDNPILGGFTRLDFLLAPPSGPDGPMGPSGPGGPGGPSGTHRDSGATGPGGPPMPGGPRFHLSQNNSFVHGHAAGRLILPPPPEDGETVDPIPPIELERVFERTFFATPAARTEVRHVPAPPPAPGGGSGGGKKAGTRADGAVNNPAPAPRSL